MQREAFPIGDPRAATYLQQLEALASEIEVAMGAISANAVAAFQQSVANQEMLCSNLALIAGAATQEFKLNDQSSPSCLDSDLEHKIKTATNAVCALNLKYAALVKHSGRSIALLLSLCRSHMGEFQESRGPRMKRQTWSCEV